MSLRKLSESQWNLLMAHYGEPETANEKLAIADVAKYKDKLIATTRRVVGA